MRVYTILSFALTLYHTYTVWRYLIACILTLAHDALVEINPLVRPLVAWVGTEYIKKGLHFQVGKHIADNYVVD